MISKYPHRTEHSKEKITYHINVNETFPEFFSRFLKSEKNLNILILPCTDAAADHSSKLNENFLACSHDSQRQLVHELNVGEIFLLLLNPLM